MKKFLIISNILLIIALIITILSFVYINSLLIESSSGKEKESVSKVLKEAIVGDEDDDVSTLTPATASIPEEGIPLRNLQLSDSQKATLSGMGIDVDTFVVTPAIIACGESKIGVSRMSEIIAGDSPSIIEIGTLSLCLRAE